MARPRAVRQAVAKSEALIEKLSKEAESAESEAQAGIDQHLAELETETDDPGTAQNEPTGGGADEDEGGGQATTPPAPEPEPDPEPPEPPASDDYRKRYEELRTEHERLLHSNTALRGKYDAEVPRMAAEIRELKDQVKEFKQAPPAGDTADTEQVQKIKAKLREEFPDDLVDSFEAMVRLEVAKAAPNAAPVDNSEDIQEMRRELQAVKHQTAEQQLTALVPDWRDIQTREHDAWVKFLQVVEPYSGKERNELLQQAWADGDVARAAQFFNSYKHERDANKRPTEPPPPEPESTAGEPQRTPPDKKVWKYSEIQAIEREARNPHGRFSGKKQQLKTLRDRIAQASAEGRVDYQK